MSAAVDYLSSLGPLVPLMRRKAISEEHMGDTNLARVLGIIDLSCLAIGSTLGLGIYVLAGDVARNQAGPAVVISFLVAALASMFAALCYAEFAARVPKAGSAYVYSYVCVGEFVAFIIGWNLILEYVIGTASVARGYSTYVDSIFDQKMEKAFRSCCAIDVDFLSKYPDFFAFSLVLVLSTLLAVGVKESTRFNNVFTCCNLVVVVYVITCGLFKLDINNWKVDPDSVPDHDPPYNVGDGGFFPFGFSGMMAGAARCFYGFVGFDAVATTGEEAKNPQRSIPLAIVIGLVIIFLSYFGVSAVLTLMWPYYLQDENAPLPAVFDHLHWESARWIVTVGALFGLSSSLLGALFPLPRILYAMANDGLIFRWLSSIHPRFQTPFWSTLLAGLFAAVMASLFDLPQLVDMMSIGTLLAYTLVAVCVLILRYQQRSLGLVDHTTEEPSAAAAAGSTDRLLPAKRGGGALSLLLNLERCAEPTADSAAVVNLVTIGYGVVTLAFCAVIVYAADPIMKLAVWAVVLTVVLGVLMLVCVVIILLQPQSKAHLFFKVPLVPFLPMLSVFVNIYLMMKLSSSTWIRFGVWMALGFVMYFGYGIWNSSALAKNQKAAKQQSAIGLSDLGQSTLPGVPTITIEPATPRANSASGSPSPTRRAAEPTESTELVVHTVTETDDGALTRWHHEQRPAASTDDQEEAVLMAERLAEQQLGLHCVIVAVLRSDSSDSGRGRQMALAQRQTDESLPRPAYRAPPPAAAEYEEAARRWAEQDVAQHEAVCRCLGAPSAGARPIRVSAEVHSEDPQAEQERHAMEAFESDNADEKIVEVAAETAAEEEVETAETAAEGADETAAEAAESEMDAALAAAHRAICECLTRGWTDLGRGALLADQQRERYGERASPPPPPPPPPPPAAASAPLSLAELQQFTEMVMALHAGVCDCLGQIRTPPNTPTGGRRQRPPLAPLALSGTETAPPAAGRPSPARRPPLQRVKSDSSFTSIPPQSPDSPFAKRVGAKFVIIPVGADDGTDSEREEEPAAEREEELRRAMRSVQDEVRSALERVESEREDAEAPADGAAEDGPKSESSDEPGGNSSSAAPASEISDGTARGSGSSGGGGSEGSGETSQRPSTSDEQASESLGEREEDSIPSDGPAPASVDGPTKETRQAMKSVLQQFLATVPVASDDQQPASPDEPAEPAEPAPEETGATSVGAAEKPPEPSMKDQLDQIIKQAVQKAARRVTEAGGDGDQDQEQEQEDDEPVSPPPLDRLGDGMHRVRSRKKQQPSFDMAELMARFDRK